MPGILCTQLAGLPPWMAALSPTLYSWHPLFFNSFPLLSPTFSCQTRDLPIILDGQREGALRSCKWSIWKTMRRCIQPSWASCKHILWVSLCEKTLSLYIAQRSVPPIVLLLVRAWIQEEQVFGSNETGSSRRFVFCGFFVPAPYVSTRLLAAVPPGPMSVFVVCVFWSCSLAPEYTLHI